MKKIITERTCCICKKVKLLADFAKDPTTTTGRGYICKDCKAIYAKYWYRKNREKYVEYARKKRQDRYDAVMASLEKIEESIKCP